MASFNFTRSFIVFACLTICRITDAIGGPVTPDPQFTPLIPLTLNNSVNTTSVSDYLKDQRVFNAEFYIKYNPQLAFRYPADIAAATAHWNQKGASQCYRGSFQFNAKDYLARYPELGKSCLYGIQHFVTNGFNEGRIGSSDSYPIIFDFNYYVDAANDPSLNSEYVNGTMDQVDIQVYWLNVGIAKGQSASPFFSSKEYSYRYYPLSSLTPKSAIDQYLLSGQAAGQFGKLTWQPSSSWLSLVNSTQNSNETAGAQDLVRTFVAANRKTTTSIVHSPKWCQASSGQVCGVPASRHVCTVPAPTENDDFKNITQYLTPNGVASGCDVVRLAPNRVYHIVLPQGLPVSQDYVLNHIPSLQINNATDFVFDGNGSTLMFTGSTTGIDMNNSRRVIVENLNIDWGSAFDPNPLWRGPLFAAIGSIVVDGPTSAHIAFSSPLPTNFSPYIYAFNLWDAERGQIAADDYLNTGGPDQACDAGCIASGGKPIQSTYVRGNSLYTNSSADGNYVASILSPYNGRTVMVRFQQFEAVALDVDYGSQDVRIIDTQIHTSPYIALLAVSNGGRGFSAENVSVTPSQNRPISSIADGIHLDGFSGDVVIENGNFQQQGDDCMNITESWDTLSSVTSASSFVMEGEDSAPSVGDTLAFFDPALGFMGSAQIASVGPPGLAPWAGVPVSVQLSAPLSYLRAGLHAIDINHVPSRIYISGVNISNKLGHGILMGGFHSLIQNSTIQNTTMSGIMVQFSTFWSESTGVSDFAIRNNQITGTNYVPKMYEVSPDGTNAYPYRNAAVAIFENNVTDYDNVESTVTGIYPAFQNIEISGNKIQSATGAAIFLSGTANAQLNQNEFLDCAPVPNPDPLYSFFGSDSSSAVVMSFANNVSLSGNLTSSNPNCSARVDISSTRGITLNN